MTIDTKHGRELLAKATPGEWHATHYEGIGYRVWKEHPSPTPGYATVTITDGQWNEADGDLIVWLRNNCAALLSAAERVEALLSRVEDVTGATDVMTYDQACDALDAMTEERLATKEKLATAEREAATLRERVKARGEWLDRIAQAVGYDSGANPADVLQRIDDMRAAERRVAELEAERREAVKRGNWFESECGRQKLERIAAELRVAELEAELDAATTRGRELVDDAEHAALAAERARDEALKEREEIVSAIIGHDDEDMKHDPKSVAQLVKDVLTQRDEAVRRAEAAEATIEQALVILEANARQHDCAGVDCANCGGPQASHELREYLATLDPKEKP